MFPLKWEMGPTRSAFKDSDTPEIGQGYHLGTKENIYFLKLSGTPESEDVHIVDITMKAV